MQVVSMQEMSLPPVPTLNLRLWDIQIPPLSILHLRQTLATILLPQFLRMPTLTSTA